MAPLGKILTLNNLRKLHTLVVDWSCICKKIRETIDHLLLYCKLASALWNFIFGLFGIEWVMSLRVVDHLACWREQFGRQHSLAVWKMVLVVFDNVF
jgi:hypothetical protein